MRRVGGLPGDAHCDLLPIICDSIPVMDALFNRSANVINWCLKSNNLTVCAVARHAVYYSRMRSPMGISAFNIVVCVMAYVQEIYQ